MANIKQKCIVSLPLDLRDEITDGLASYGKVKIVGLGIFETRVIPARPGRNPKTGDIMQIKEYVKIKFRPTKQLKLTIC